MYEQDVKCKYLIIDTTAKALEIKALNELNSQKDKDYQNCLERAEIERERTNLTDIQLDSSRNENKLLKRKVTLWQIVSGGFMALAVVLGLR